MKKITCNSQKHCEQYNCCELKNYFYSIVAIENWNHESSKFTKTQTHKIIEVQRSVKLRKAMELLLL